MKRYFKYLIERKCPKTGFKETIWIDDPKGLKGWKIIRKEEK